MERSRSRTRLSRHAFRLEKEAMLAHESKLRTAFSTEKDQHAANVLSRFARIKLQIDLIPSVLSFNGLFVVLPFVSLTYRL
jgi:hypothetical protein